MRAGWAIPASHRTGRAGGRALCRAVTLATVFRRHSAADAGLQPGNRLAAAGVQQNGAEGERSGDGVAEAPSRPARDLETSCACGHTRRDHHGLRMEDNGSCLECDCAEFEQIPDPPDAHEETIARLHAAIAHVERVHELAMSVCTVNSSRSNGRPG